MSKSGALALDLQQQSALDSWTDDQQERHENEPKLQKVDRAITTELKKGLPATCKAGVQKEYLL